MKKYLFILIFGCSSSFSKAQLVDGSTAPDFNLVDINGNNQNLYTYLDAGKTVFIDIFAAHCPTCWAYHNTHAIRDLYNENGLTGTISQDVMVLAIEYDAGNGINELTGLSGVTQGDWVSGTTYPIINPEGIDRTNILAAYDVTFFPMIYAICPDRKITLIGTQNKATLYNHVSGCDFMGLGSNVEKTAFVFYNNGALHLSGIKLEELPIITVYDVSGKQLMTQQISSPVISLEELASGLYLYSIIGSHGAKVSGKFFKGLF